MKKQRQHSVFQNWIRMLLGVVLAVGLLTVLFFRESSVVKALAIPKDYGTGYGIENLDTLSVGATFEGITRQNEEKTFLLQFSDSVNGLVTLAWISQNNSLEGYTFQISHGTEIKLGVVTENGELVSGGRFFGIGNDKYPFKGTISISGAQDVPVSMRDENSWPYLFNNLSNEAAIVNNGQKLYTSPAQIGHDGGTASMALCKVLTVTKDDTALDLRGFQFGRTGSTVRVSGSGSVALFAGKVEKTDNASSFSVNLSGCFPGGKYEVESSDGDAGGIIGAVNAGVTAKITLPGSFACDASTRGNQTNAGVLVGSNYGELVITGAETITTITFTGTISGTGSSGLIGANQGGSKATFEKDILISDLTVTASGLRAGAIAGTCKGPIHVQNVTVQNATFATISSEAARAGGLIGSVDMEYASNYLTIAEKCKITLSGNTIQASSGTAGGFVGYLKSGEKTFSNVTVSDLTITGSGTVGGYIGNLDAKGDFILVLPDTAKQITFDNSVTGTCGGVIGSVTSQLQNTVSISGALSPTIKGTGTAFGGVVGNLQSGYLKAERLSLNNTIACGAKAGDVAGVVAAGAILDIDGLTVTENNATGSILVAQTGQGSVVRLGGSIINTSTTVLNLVYQQDASLIYLDGTYSGNDAQNNDIGNYGQVVRNDTLNIISLTDDHIVSIASPLDASGDIALSNAADFAKLAITFHTKGKISGVEGYNEANYSQLLAKSITLTGEINLTNTGIEQLTPSKDVGTAFSGILNGDGHTITLAIGQRITDTGSDNSGIQAGPNNERQYLGLFAKIDGATVQNLTINGTLMGATIADVSGNASSSQYMGALAGYASGSVTLTNCKFQSNISQEIASRGYAMTMYMGGAVGQMMDVTSLSVTGCTFGAIVTDNCTAATKYNWYGGGLAGSIDYTGGGKIDLNGNTISTKIEKKGTYEDVNIGGLVGKLTSKNYVVVDLAGTSAQVVSVTANEATVSSGGILGNTFEKCHVIVDGAYSGTVSAGTASLGGLIHTLNGRMTVENGFSIGGTFTASGEMKGLLLADGKNAWVTIKASPDTYTTVEATDIDLFVGRNIGAVSEQDDTMALTSVGIPEYGGIVTVETGSGVGKMPASSDWYDRMNVRSNEKTRYYFNVEKLTEQQARTPAEALLYWHLCDYAKGKEKDKDILTYVLPAGIAKADNNFTATADIDMTGYCFYPTKKEGVAINFGGNTLTFGAANIPAAVKDLGQFYGLQAGLLSDVTAVESPNATVSSLINIRLAGTVAYLKSDDGSYYDGSGALICGTVRGNRTSGNTYTLTLNIQNVVLDGIVVETSEDYRPLMLNQLGSYVTATVSGISQADAVYAGKTQAASSLMGRGGYLESGTTPSSNVRMTLSKIVLDGNKATTIFTKATLFYDVTYASGTGSIIYNFNLAEDWDAQGTHINKVTYGAELSLNEDQRFYFDQDLPVRPDEMPPTSTDFYAFDQYYLPYVYIVSNGEETNLLLSVNRKGADFIVGWGTYENPYIIESAKQLEYLANLLSNPNLILSDGWTINFPQGDWANLSTLDLTDYYEVTASGNKLTYDGKELNQKVLLAYLAGAYYKLNYQAELTLPSNFAGIGSTYYPFHGVFHGNDGTVIMPGKTVDSNGYGFIRVANGCVVLKLTVVYSGDIILSGSNSFENAPATSAPTADTLTTGLPHFGGVIAWIVGGDNQIDTVAVTMGTNPETAERYSVTPGARHSVCGGYVGLISGGGVLLNNLTETNAFAKDNYQYYNNYVGRVLGGYAIAIDGKKYDNDNDSTSDNGTDFVIPAISMETLTSHKRGYDSSTFTLDNAQDLLLFSFGINSGAFAHNVGVAYGLDSRSRRGDYTKVGTQNPEGVILENGKYLDDSPKTSIIADYFVVTKSLKDTSLTVKLTGTTYDMSVYGNGFRGMSGVYDKAEPPTTTFKISSFGAESGNATIKLNMDMKQYARGSGTSAIVEPDSIVAYGLFGRLGSAVTFQNLTLKGTVSVLYLDADKLGEDNAELTSDPFTKTTAGESRSVGGLLGRSQDAVTVDNVSLQDMVIVSPDIAGGFVGNHSAGNLTVTNSTANKTTIKGKRHAGGVVGFIGNGENAISNVQILDSIVETRVTGTKNDSVKIGTGGLVGYMDGGTKLTVTDCTLTKTAIVFYCNFQSSSSNVGSGGLVGGTAKPFEATNCTVDGCVIFSVSNLSGAQFLYQDTTSTGFLPDELVNHLIYNGGVQKSATILAYFLRQSSGSTGYSIGASGGILGVTLNNVTLTGCTVTSSAAPTLIISHNGAAGLIGEQRTLKNPTISLTGCKVCTDAYDMFIVSGTRAAGAVAYRDKQGTAVYTADKVSVVGSAAHPVRIIQSVYNATDAAGLFGELSAANVTASNCQVSYCIIAGAKASGVYSTIASGSTITLNNIHVSNNLIYAKKGYYSGGLFCLGSATATVNGAYIGDNWILGTNGAGGVAGNNTSTIDARYLILDENVIRKVTEKTTNYTFAVNSLEGDAAFSALVKTKELTNVGLIAGSNSSTIKAIAVSCSATDWNGDSRAQNVGTENGKTTVVYAAYGAWNEYHQGAGTPQKDAIEAMKAMVTTDGESLILKGDSVTTIKQESKQISTPLVLKDNSWWLTTFNLSAKSDKEMNQAKATMSTLADEAKNNPSANGTLPLLCLTENADDTLTGYLNLLTGDGFGQAKTQGLVTITSQRYSVDSNGRLKVLTGQGSVSYNDAQKKFVVGTYDNLEGDDKTLTILTVKFGEVYTMHVALYYHRAVELMTYVVPLAGEQYYLPGFLGNKSNALSVSYGDPFTLYVEYNYNDVAKTLEADTFTNFYKRIALTDAAGSGKADNVFENGTAFVLIDLNAETAAGYAYYTLTLTQGLERDSNYIDFENFKRGDTPFVLPEISGIGKLEDRVCTDEKRCYTERYLLVVFPVQNKTDESMAYNMKAVIDEDQRKDMNVTVNYEEVKLAHVQVWPAPTMTSSATGTGTISNLSGKSISMDVTHSVTFPAGYVDALKGQSSKLYESHTLQLRDEKEKNVSLPSGTQVKVAKGDTTVYESVLSEASLQISFPVDEILAGLTANEYTASYQITMDFSQVSEADFRNAFLETKYYLEDTLYLSSTENVRGDTKTSATQEFAAEREEAKIKLAVVPEDNRYLGINLEKPDDSTNSGLIDFTVSADFSALEKNFTNATLSFVVEKKVYNETSGKYGYESLTEEEASIWVIQKNGQTIETDTLSVESNEAKGQYRLVVSLTDPVLEQTNYRLTVTITATADDGIAHETSDYFVFLICRLQTDPQ